MLSHSTTSKLSYVYKQQKIKMRNRTQLLNVLIFMRIISKLTFSNKISTERDWLIAQCKKGIS